MKVLWTAGRLSAREVHERVEESLGWAYSTTRTTLERLAKKGVLSKQRFHGLTLYEPKISKARGLARRVLDFAERVLESEPAPVVSLFARSEALTEAEIEELSRLLDGERRETRETEGKGAR
jgi:BlaI family transcriptional regulator, penicillinase repressor